MKKKLFFKYTCITICLFIINFAKAQEVSTFPVPQNNPNQLFYLQRTPNTNTIVYELSYKDGILNKEEPVHVFWIRYNEKGQQAELSSIQRDLAYGIKSKLLSADKYELHFLSYKKFVMHLMKAADNKYHVYAIVNQKHIMLRRIFISINGGSFLKPNIEYVELEGIDSSTGMEVTERMKI